MASIVIAAVGMAIEGITFATVASMALAVVSTVIQQSAAEDAADAQRRAQEDAARRADEAKGTKLITEGEISSLQVLYGRNLVGGNRVYHGTFNNYNYAAPAAGGQAFESGSMSSSISGNRHEFLITQQAICVGGINACYNIDIDGRKINGEYINEFNEVVWNPELVPQDVPATGHWIDVFDIQNPYYSEMVSYKQEWVEDVAAHTTNVTGPGITHIDPYTYGLRVHVYPDGGVADPLMYTNDIKRNTAYFTNTTNATCVYRYNRDDPQFSGVPAAQFYVEGMKVKTILGIMGAFYLSPTKTYSNNSALCLLDYLTNASYGKGVPESDIDLDSFYTAFRVCERVVKTDVPREGGLWSKKDAQHDVRLYECNLGLDTSKPLRENIETILGTMGNAELVWSAGKYKLSVSYPTVFGTQVHNTGDLVQYGTNLYRSLIAANVNTPVVGAYWADGITDYITDDDIIRDNTTSLAWPSASVRLNFATVRFLNESKDFKEDTVSWPVKTGSVYATYLATDSGVQLETEVFATGISSYYNALARAEQIVRESRDSVTYEIDVDHNFIHIEPGDFIKVNSSVLQIPGELLRITKVEPNDKGIIKLSGTKFDAANLAWNVNDDEIVPIRNIYSNALTNASNIQFNSNTFNGYITWTRSTDNRAIFYRILTTTTYDGLNTIWTERGTVSSTYFELGEWYNTSFAITVVAVAADKRMAPEVDWPILAIPYQFIPNATSLTYTETKEGIVISWVPSVSTRLRDYEIRAGSTWGSSTLVTNTKSTSLLTVPSQITTTYFISAVDILGLYSVAPSSVIVSITPPVVAVLNYSLTGSTIAFNWEVPSYLLAIDRYELYDGDTLLGSTRATEWQQAITFVGTHTFKIKAFNLANVGGAFTTVNVTISIPSAPQGVVIDYLPTTAVVSWSLPATSSLPIKNYLIKYGAVWSTATVQATADALQCTIPLTWFGGRSFLIAAVDVNGNEGATATAYLTVSAPSTVTSFTHTSIDNQLFLSWDANISTGGKLLIQSYELRKGATWETGDTIAVTSDTKQQLTVMWSGVSATFHIKAKDINGNIGASVEYILNIAAPSVITPGYTINETVATISWTDATFGTLPIAAYEVRLGVSWAVGTIVGSALDRSISLPITWLGSRTYWIAARDTSGNYGIAASVDIVINSHGIVGNLAYTLYPSNPSVTLAWTASSGTLPAKTYKIRYGDIFGDAVLLGEVDTTTYNVPIAWLGNRKFWVSAIDSNLIEGVATSITINILQLVAPSVNYVINTDRVDLDWTIPAGTLPVSGYRVLYNSIIIAEITATTYSIPITWVGPREFTVIAVDNAANVGLVGSVNTVVTIPTAPTIDILNSKVGGVLLDQYRVAWIASVVGNTQLPIAYYEIGYGATVLGTTLSTMSMASADWIGARIFWVAAIDIKGNRSVDSSVELTVIAPSAPPNFSSQVIDNNVLLYWGNSTATLPISSYEFSRENTFNTNLSEYIGKKSGGFTTVFETAANIYTYYVRAIDIAGNIGAYSQVSANVFQPPGFILNTKWLSDFSGTKSGAIFDTDASLLMPVNLTETWTTHFTTIRVRTMVVAVGGTGYAVNDTFRLNTGTATENATGQVSSVSSGVVTGVTLTSIGRYSIAPTASAGVTTTLSGVGTGLTLNVTSGVWSTPQDQINSGMQYFTLGAPALGYYEEIFDYGVILAASMIAVVPDGMAFNSPTLTYAISTSADGVSYTTPVNAASMFGSNFRYVKVRLTVVSEASDDLYDISALAVTLSATEKTDGGTTNVRVNMNGTYSQSGYTITATAVGHTRLVGEAVDLNVTSGTANSGVYVIGSVSTNTFTVTSTTLETTSGNLEIDPTGTPVIFGVPFVDVVSITMTPRGTTPITHMYDFTDTPYPTYFKALLFNAGGTRVSGVASWNAKGY